MTPRDLIDDLRSRINPAYACQVGTESYERRLCAEALEAQADEIERLREYVAHLAVPVGWKLVPTRPTEAMMDGLRTGSRKDVPGNPLCEIRWAAALAKTPTHNAELTGDPLAGRPG